MTRFEMKFFYIILIATAFSLGLVIPGWGLVRNVAIVYPDVEEPYSSIFRKILDGINHELEENTQAFSVGGEADMEHFENKLRQGNFEGIIALGKRGILASRSVDTPVPVIVGALPLDPGGLSGISLEPDPAILFTRLKELAPHIKRICVVYSSRNQWVVQLAEKASKEQSLILSSYPVRDLREAVYQYRTLLQNIDPARDAIWLPLDSVASNEDVVLPLLLKSVWEKRILMFSSKPSHAQRGSLFSMYPDYYGMGISLAKMTRKALEGPKMPEVEPLGDLEIAVNLRTAAHIGLRFSRRQQEGFNLLFPTR